MSHSSLNPNGKKWIGMAAWASLMVGLLTIAVAFGIERGKVVTEIKAHDKRILKLDESYSKVDEKLDQIVGSVIRIETQISNMQNKEK